MTDPTEQTAERGLGDWLIEELHLTIRQLRPLTLLAETDPELAAVFDVPLSRLREDLAIAARARACSPFGTGAVRWFGKDGLPYYRMDAADLLAYLLGGEQ